jgi:hypothetical protein
MKSYWRIKKSLTDHYVVKGKLNLPRGSDGNITTFKEGRRICTEIPNPWEIELDRLEPGENPRHFITGASILIISELLLHAFQEAKIDNFETFPVILKDRKSNRTWNSYYAFNVLGLLDAVLLEECKYMVLSPMRDESIDLYPMYSFDKVVLSQIKLENDFVYENKTLKPPYRIFRSVYNPAEELYISSDVKEIIKVKTPPEKWGILFSEIIVK